MPVHSPNHPNHRRAFTLVELLVAITIITLLATTILFGMAGMQTTAKVQRTKSQLARIHEMLAEKWESYETRSLSVAGSPLNNSSGTSRQRAALRLAALRELMRLEMPDRMTDVMPNESLVLDSSGTLIPDHGIYISRTGIAIPGLYRYYVNRATVVGTWSKANEGAECLYMILARTQIGDSNGLEFFSEQEVGDTDNDGMPEILDAWGNPIHFIRWAPGYSGPSSIQTGDPDSMDLLSADPREIDDSAETYTFALFPLVFSSGPDGLAHIASDFETALQYRDTGTMAYNAAGYKYDPEFMASDPYVIQASGGEMLGQPTNPNSDGHVDNIYNHYITTQL